MAQGSGYGKVILFGEHFVVHGIPAIASAIGDTTVATVEPVEDLTPSGNEGSMAGDGWVLEDDRPANPGYKTEKFDHQKESIELVLEAAQFDPSMRPIKISLAGNLKAVGGVGASAAVCVSIANALNSQFSLGFSQDRINDIAYEGEKAYTGSPSGIDNTAATFGGLIWFIKGDDGPFIERLTLETPVDVVMGNTGLTANTKAAVEGVTQRKEEQPEKYDNIFKEASELSQKAKDALMSSNHELAGVLMNRNHELLQQIEVSHPKLEDLVDIARSNGALGAKMTGGGLGGYMVALTPGQELQDKVASAMEAADFEALRTKIGI